MDRQWINLSKCIPPGLGTVAPRGAHFFYIIICTTSTEGVVPLLTDPGLFLLTEPGLFYKQPRDSLIN